MAEQKKPEQQTPKESKGQRFIVAPEAELEVMKARQKLAITIGVVALLLLLAGGGVAFLLMQKYQQGLAQLPTVQEKPATGLAQTLETQPQPSANIAQVPQQHEAPSTGLVQAPPPPPYSFACSASPTKHPCPIAFGTPEPASTASTYADTAAPYSASKTNNSSRVAGLLGAVEAN
jgi:flagellar basal body-associated protein FliL